VPDPVALAEWTGDLIAMVAFVRSTRTERATDFFRQVEANSGKTAEVLLDLMEREDMFSEIVERGIEAAGRSARFEKRRLLARVVASALDGTGLATLQDHQLLIKTVDAIEPPHVQLLVLLATPKAGQGRLVGTPWEGRWTEPSILDQWPGLGTMIRPLLAVLEREGLVESVDPGTWDSIEDNFAPSAYGRLLLQFLADDDLGSTNLGAAEIACRYQSHPSPVVYVRNLGPGIATDVRVEIPSPDGRTILKEDCEPFGLGQLGEVVLDVEIPTLSDGPPYQVLVDWTDSLGRHHTVRTVDRPQEGPF
jgi:hypothetical protein